ncbi:D-alanyl-D-alanine carboxypeptidase [Paenibacillus sp. TRM 82003]|nr:D-alanyl-D-alanine carboxypeptidase [Paenibacillus sp. TRM 82003]
MGKFSKGMATVGVLLALYAAVHSGSLDASKVNVAIHEAKRFVASSPLMPETVDIAGEAGIVVDADSGEVLYGKNDRIRMYPASTTKIMTALLALEYGRLDEPITVGAEARQRAADESSARLAEGDTLTLRDLLSGLMLPSGNDAARTIARYVVRVVDESSGEDWSERFPALMNERAAELGAKNTHFANPHGLHDPDHYTTAEDLARIAREAMNHPAFRELVASEAYVTSDGATAYQNRNQLLYEEGANYYRGANGIKTGYTSAAGYCLVASAKRGETELISVVLHSTETDIWTDTHRLLNYGF